jgi:hypothetical protein
MVATVTDITSAHFRQRGAETDDSPLADVAQAVADDFADGVEVMHHFCNLADYSEAARTFVFALVSAAHGGEKVVVYDAELADKLNCSERTVQRHRKAYKVSVKQSGVELIEFAEYKFDQKEGKNPPTEYLVLCAPQLGLAVVRARASKHWHPTDRAKQCAALQWAASMAFKDIPRGDSMPRPDPRPRLATAEIATCMKVADTKLRRMKKLAGKLPERTRSELLSDTGPDSLRRKWEALRSEMDALFESADSQTIDDVPFDERPDNLSGHPTVAASAPAGASGRVAVEEEERAPTSPADAEAWNNTFSGLRAPPVRAVTVGVRPPPGPAPFVHPDDFPVEPLRGGGP